MQRSPGINEADSVSEMAIVDTFTKLIFGEEEGFSAGELQIIRALRAADVNVLLDRHREMGSYLRALGVREMIDLVSQVQAQLLGNLQVLADEAGRAARPGMPATG